MDFTKLISIIITIGLGVLLMGIVVTQKLKAKKAAESWSQVAGIVQKSELSIEHSRDSDGDRSTHYYPLVTYSYIVDSLSYTNNAISFGKSSLSKKRSLSKLAEYPQGATVNVYYDPADPTQAVLEPKASSFVTILFGIILVITGIYLFFVM